MIDLTYNIDSTDGKINLYEVKEGIKIFITDFDDREDLLYYIEEHYAMANLIVINSKED